MTAPSGTAGPEGAYLPGLDGLRAVAVAGVLGYHSGWGWLRGGFLGVSLFFTLSGFLIGGLIVSEHRRTGSVDLRRFWSRRARRLLPAAFAGISLAIAVTAVVGTASQRTDLLGDVIGAALYAANWRFVADGGGYAALYEAPSALQHVWSLAVEEQIYLVLPLLLAGALALGRTGARLAVTAATTAVVGIGAVLSLGGADLESLYYGTHARVAEVLVGVLLALLVASPAARPPDIARRVAGPVALTLVLWSWTAWRFADVHLFRGGLVVHSVLVAVVLWSVTAGPSPLTRGLERRPLVWVGRRSYGIYLYHWPLFLLAEQAETALPRWALLAGAWAGSALLAAVSYAVLEQPVRAGRVVRSRVAAGAGVAALPAAAVLAAALVVVPAPVHDPEATAARIDALASGRQPRPAAGTGAATATRAAATPAAPSADPEAGIPAGPPVRLAIFGDSIAAANGLGLAEWAVDHPRLDLVPGVTIPGCTLVATGVRWSGESPIEISDGCDWRRSWPQTVSEHRPDVAVVAVGALDALPWSLPGTPGRLHVGDPRVDERIRAEIEAINGAMAEAGVHVLWLTLPAPVSDNGSGPALARINRMIDEAAAGHDRVGVFDMAAVVDAWTREGGLRRSDGVHLDAEDSRRLARERLGPAVLAVAADLRSAPP